MHVVDIVPVRGGLRFGRRYRSSNWHRLGIRIRVRWINHPRPPLSAGWAKGVPRLPRLGFPPWNPPSEAPPPIKGIPKGGHPSRPRPVMDASLRSARSWPWGRIARPTVPGSPYGARPLQDPTPPMFPSAPQGGSHTPSELSPFQKGEASYNLSAKSLFLCPF